MHQGDTSAPGADVSQNRGLRALLRVAGVLAIIVGIGLFLLTVTVGDCSAFGGTCPRTTGNVNDDVIGGGAIAGALVGAGAVFASRPRMQAWWRALVFAIPAAVVAAVLAHSSTST